MWFWKVSDRFSSGIPDFVGVFLGRFFAIELKATGKKPRKLQSYMLEKIRQAGGAVLAADNLEDVERFIEEMNDRHKQRIQT